MIKNILAYVISVILMIPQRAISMDATTHYVQPYRYEAWQVQLGYQLLYEVSKGTLENIERLLSQGAMPGCIDKYGDTILHKAAWRGDLSIMNSLLLLKLPINARSSKGETPLHLAAKRFKEGSRKHKEIIDVLLSCRADSTIRDNEGIAAQDYFTNEITPKEEPKSVNHYITSMCFSSKKELSQMLQAAIKKGDLELVKKLIKAGAPIEGYDESNDPADFLLSPLQRAALEGKKDIAIFLIAEGACIDATSDALAESPLLLAAEKGHKAVVELLLSRGADVEKRSCDHTMPLHAAAAGGHTEVVELLLKHKADMEARNRDDRTPLHLAAMNKRAEIVQLLLSWGANSQACDYEDRTAASYFTSEMKAALKSRKAPYKQKGNVDQVVTKEPVSPYSKNSQHNIQEKNLLVKSVYSAVPATHISFTDNDRKLLESLVNRNYSEVKRLLEMKAHVGVRDMHGDTPLHKAAWKLDAAMMELLLQHKADPHVVNNSGSTALDVLCKKLKNIMQKLDRSPVWPDKEKKIYANAQQCQRLLFQSGALAEVAHFSTLFTVWDGIFSVLQNVIESQSFLLHVKARSDQKKALAEAFLKFDYTLFMEILIALGADVNRKDANGNTPFMNVFFAYCQEQEIHTSDSTAERERQERIKRYENLLDFFLFRVKQNYPPELLHIALAYYHLYKLPDKAHDTIFKSKIQQCIEVFCGRGVRVNSAAMLNPFAVCEKKGPNGFALLPPRTRAWDDRTLEHYLDALLINGADCNFKAEGGYTPLHRALEGKNKALANFLLKRGARLPKEALLAVDRNRYDDWIKKNRSIVAIEQCQSKNGLGGMDLLIELVKHGADCGFIDSDGNTALHFAAQYNGLEQIKFLLERGCPVNQRNKNGVTPLFLTSTLTVIQALLSHGAAVNIVDNEERNPMHAVCELLIKRDGRIGDTWKDIVALYNSKGLSLNDSDKQGKTPLMSLIFLDAASYEYKSTFNELIRLGGDIHACDKRGWGLLHYLLALQRGHSPDKTISLLLLNGINPNVQNEDGDTPLHFVYRYPNRWCSKDTYKDLMMSYGAQLTIRNKKGQTPLEVTPLPLPVDSAPTHLMPWE